MLNVTWHGKTIAINPAHIRGIEKSNTYGGTWINIPGFYPPEGVLLVSESFKEVSRLLSLSE